MPFDVSAAKQAGYSDKEIVDFIGGSTKFDHEAARSAGYSDAEILNHFQTSPEPPGAIAKVWDYVSAPMRGVARLGGKLDVAAGIKRPEQAEANVKPYGELGTKAALTGLAPFGALGRILTSGGLEAATAPTGEGGKEALRGMATAATAEGALKATPALTSLLPGAAARAIKAQTKAMPKMFPREGEQWIKKYTYGAVPGSTEPKLLQDVLTAQGKTPSPTTPKVVGGVADTAMNAIRRFLQQTTYNPQSDEQK